MSELFSYTPEELEVLDRMEAEYNMRARSRAAQCHFGTVRCLTDDGLRRVATKHRRALEDIEAGDSAKSARSVKLLLGDVEGEQEYRAALAESWLANEDGTDCYTSFMRRGGLAAVLHEGARPASYRLARTLDWERFEQGTLHVLNWERAA